MPTTPSRSCAKAHDERCDYLVHLAHEAAADPIRCILHAYNQDLQPLLETGLADSPEVRALRGRFHIMEDYLRNHIRCVALSQDNRRYLFTAVDEAWCVDIGGDAV